MYPRGDTPWNPHGQGASPPDTPLARASRFAHRGLGLLRLRGRVLPGASSPDTPSFALRASLMGQVGPGAGVRAAGKNGRPRSARLDAARALARAGLARAATPRDGGVLAAVDTEVGHRARALLQPAPRPHRVLTTVLIALIMAAALAAVGTERGTERRFEHARAVYVHRP